MKLQVRHPDSRIEILTLTDPLTINRCSCGCAHLVTATGMLHFFDEIGAYAGFGLDLAKADFPTQEDQQEYVLKVNSEREFLEEEED